MNISKVHFKTLNILDFANFSQIIEITEIIIITPLKNSEKVDICSIQTSLKGNITIITANLLGSLL